MPFFDIVGDVAKHQLEKTDMGDNRINGIILGTVVKNYDKEKQGFIQVNITTRDYEENKMVWARMALPYGGSKWGEYFLPEVGDQVLVAFEQGCIDRAFVLAAVPLANSNFMQKAYDEDNQFKKIVTKNGNTIYIEDNKEGEGDNDKITITTAKGLNKFELNNEKKLLLISDKDGENKIEMKTENGQMEIQAKQKLTIKVGDNIKIFLNGSNGTVSIEGSKLKFEATDTAELKSNNRVNMEGGNVTVSGNSMLKLKSSGPVSVEGTPIKLG